MDLPMPIDPLLALQLREAHELCQRKHLEFECAWVEWQTADLRLRLLMAEAHRSTSITVGNPTGQ